MNAFANFFSVSYLPSFCHLIQFTSLTPLLFIHQHSKKSIIFPYVCIHIMHYCLPFSPSFSFPLPPSSEPSPLFLSLCQTIFGVLFPSVHLRKTRKRKRIRNIYIHPDSVHLWIPFPFLLVPFYILLPHTQQQQQRQLCVLVIFIIKYQPLYTTTTHTTCHPLFLFLLLLYQSTVILSSLCSYSKPSYHFISCHIQKKQKKMTCSNHPFLRQETHIHSISGYATSAYASALTLCHVFGALPPFLLSLVYSIVNVADDPTGLSA